MIKKKIVNEIQVNNVFQDDLRLSRKITSKSVFIIDLRVYRLHKE